MAEAGVPESTMLAILGSHEPVHAGAVLSRVNKAKRAAVEILNLVRADG